MAGGPDDLSRPRARAGGVGPSRCRRRSRPARSHAALAVAAICRSSADRHQESRQSVADQTPLTKRVSYRAATSNATKNLLAAYFVSLSVTNFPEYLSLCGGREPTSW